MNLKNKCKPRTLNVSDVKNNSKNTNCAKIKGGDCASLYFLYF